MSTIYQDYNPLPIAEWFEAQVKRTPDALAVVFEDEQVSYEKLNQQANQLAHRLRAAGVRLDGLVGICVERSVEMVVGLLGILKAGGAYIPLDPAYPAERLAFMLQDAGVAVLLTQTRLLKNLPQVTAEVMCLDQDWGATAPARIENPISDRSPDSLAYVIYTSGSTGQPKGAMLTQRAISNHMQWMQTAFNWQAADRVLQKTPFSFDASVWEFYAPLLSGGQLIMARPEGHLDSAYLVRTLIEQQITVLQLVPTLLRILVEEPRLAACSQLRHLFCGGEAFPVELAERLRARLPDVRIHNLYGPTEATIDATHWTWGGERDRTTIPIGWPVANMQCYVLDEQLQPVPPGVPGELYLGGVDLARGYWQRPELTAAKFVPNPFVSLAPAVAASEGAERPGLRLYRTGDLCQYLPNGALEFLGRIDHQVKIRGYRIELGEIEAALEQHPAVRAAVVNVRADQPGSNQLVAYVVATAGPPPDVGKLRRYLQARLPEYMTPARFVVLEQLPLTPSGKVDRRALPAPAASERENDFVPASTATQQMLSGVWEQVFGIKAVSIHDNFFELGGHSLLAAQIVTRLQPVLGHKFTARTLFEAPTIALLAERVEILAPALKAETLAPIECVARTEPLPLSYAQQQLWLLDQLEPGNVAYNIAYPLQLQGDLHPPTLQRSLSEIVRRHESLRTTFVRVERRPCQVIAPPAPLPLPLIDLSDWPAADRPTVARQLAREEARQPFDLARGPLLRVTLLRLAQQEHVLLLTLHHIVVDGWSLGVLLNELGAIYTALLAGRPAPLPDLPLQYADYAVWQRHWLQSAEVARQLADWQARLAGAPSILNLPTDHPRPRVQTFQGARETVELSPALSASLQQLSQAAGTTLFMTLLAAFQVLLQRYTGQTELVVGAPVANRPRPELEKLIGYFVNTLVLRTDLAGDPPFRELLERVREVTLEAYAHQDVPFEMLVVALQPEREQSYNPLFQVMFILQNTPLMMPDLPGLRLKPVTVDLGIAQFDLTLELEESVAGSHAAATGLQATAAGSRATAAGLRATAVGLRATIEYNTNLFDNTTIRRMLDHYQALLGSIVANANQPLSTLGPLIKLEPHQMASAAAESPRPASGNRERIALLKTQLSDQKTQLSAEDQAVLKRRLQRKRN